MLTQTLLAETTFEANKAILTANFATLQTISTALQTSFDEAKKQYAAIATEKKTALDNAKKFADQIKLLQQQLDETQSKLKETNAVVANCESRNNNLNQTLGNIISEKTASITACNTSISTASAGAIQTAATANETNEANNLKKQAEKAQQDLDALVASINTTRLNNAANTGQSSIGTATTK